MPANPDLIDAWVEEFIEKQYGAHRPDKVVFHIMKDNQSFMSLKDDLENSFARRGIRVEIVMDVDPDG